MSDITDLIESLEAERDALRRDLFLARAEALQGRLFQAAALEREPERVKRAFVEGNRWGWSNADEEADVAETDAEAEADRRLAEGTI